MYDERLSFAQGGDTGQNNNSSVQPVGNSEAVWSDVINRVTENLRKRTEAIKAAVQNLNFLSDYDRSLIFRSDGRFLVTEEDTGAFRLQLDTDDLFIYPALTPGLRSGGRYRGGRVFVSGVPYCGTLGVNDITFTADGNYTGQRNYADGTDFATGTTISLGANEIVLDLVANPGIAGGVGSITAVVSSSPKTKIVLTYGTATTTTVNDILTFVNGDTTSQGSYGISNYLRASTTSAGTLAPTPFTGGTVLGAYDAEAHQITGAQLDAFFTATVLGVYVNRLADGEGLAISYSPGPVEIGSTGGRRQSLFDLPTNRVGGRTQNTTPGVGYNLFNTGREPEKIPGSIPIGKMLGGKFVFADCVTALNAEVVGTTLAAKGRPLGYSATFANLLSSSTGGTLIGYAGSGAWNADQSAAPTTVPAGTVSASLSTIVSQLAGQSANQSGSRRIGSEAITGSVPAGLLPHSLAAGSIRAQLESLLNGASSSSDGGGVNRRVSERGHQLLGPNAIEKYMDGTNAPIAGSEGIRMRFSSDGNMPTRAGLTAAENVNPGNLSLLPITMDDGAGHTLGILNDIQSGTLVSSVKLNSMSTETFKRVFKSFSVVTNFSGTYGSGAATPVPSALVLLSGISQGAATDGNGLYYVKAYDQTNKELNLLRLDGVTAPDFTGATFTPGTSKVTVFASVSEGTGKMGDMLSIVAPPTPYGAVSLYSTPLLTDVTGTATYTAAPWLTVYKPDLTSLSINNPILAAKYLPDRAYWYLASGKTRDTENILITSDASLLKGNETTTRVDASTNHHHGGQLSRTVMFTSPYTIANQSPIDGALTLTSNPIGTASMTTINSHVIAADQVISQLSSNFKKTGTILRYMLKIKFKNTVAAGDRFTMTLNFSADGTLRDQAVIDYVIPTNGAQSTVFSGQVTVPVVQTGGGGESARDVNVTMSMSDVNAGSFPADLGSPTPLAYAASVDTGGVAPPNSYITLKEVGSVIAFNT